MRTRAIVGVVVGLHLVVVGFVLLVPGCGRTTQGSRGTSENLFPPRKTEVTPQMASVVSSRGRQPIVFAGSLKTYVVKKGDILSRIARQHGVSVREIVELNNLADASKIFVNQKLLLPGGAKSGARAVASPTKVRTRRAGTELYKTRRGDCLSKIAVRHGMTVTEMRNLNELTSDRIYVGQKLFVHKKPTADTTMPDLDALIEETPIVTDDDVTHEVQEGETLEEVAEMYGVSPEGLTAVNNLVSKKIKLGMTLKIPQSE